MPEGLYIDTKQLTKGAKAFDELVKQFPQRVSDVLNTHAETIELNAKRDAPGDRGDVRKYIKADTTSNLLRKTIYAGAPHSAFIEFGTGKYAAQKVSEYPAEYQTFAAQYRRGTGPKNIKTVMVFLMDWFGRVGIKDKQQQYFIAKSVFLKGIHPHPYLIPNLINQVPKIIKDMTTLLNKLKPNV